MRNISLNKPHLFVCHASEDKEFVQHFVKMVNALGVVNRDDMTCTSVDEYKVRFGEKWLDTIHERLKNPTVIVVFIHSSNLYKSPFAMNEMGAVWINGRQNFSFLVNGFPYSSMKGVVTRLDQCAKVGEDGFAHALDDFRELLQEKMSLSPISVEEWERIKNEFVVAVTSLPKDNQKDDNVIQSFSEVIKELLDAPNSRIRLEETIETEVSKLKAELENVPSIKGNVDVSLYEKINAINLPIVSPIIAGLVSLIRWGNEDQCNHVVSVMTKIANHQKNIYGHSWADLELRMNYLFVPHCLYALLTACVLYKKFRLLNLLMRIICKNPYGKETWIIESYSDGYISDVDAQEIFNCQQTCTLALYTSRLLEDIHQLYFKRKEKDEVMTAFCLAEMLGCLYYVDMVESSVLRENDVYTPGGLFTFNYFSRQGMLSGNKAFGAMLKDIDEQKSAHPIFKAGVLDGDYEKYKTLFTLAVPDFRRKTMGL